MALMKAMMVATKVAMEVTTVVETMVEIQSATKLQRLSLITETQLLLITLDICLSMSLHSSGMILNAVV
jgi:hypothetical protein